MEVKYYITNNSELIIDVLERELCKRSISYVRIDNEVHFDNKIVRILDIEKYKRTIISLSFNKMDAIKLNELLFNESFLEFNPKKEMYKQVDQSKSTILEKIAAYEKRNNKVQKYESNRNNQLLKQYQKKGR